MPKNKKSTSQLWNYFDKQIETKQATCRFCNNSYSYYSTTGNLKVHLKRSHPEVYERIKWDRSAEITDLTDNEGDIEELHKVTDVWRYFDTDSGKKAQCVVCKAVVAKEFEDLKAHLREDHPDLLLELLQDQNSEVGSNDGNDDNTYTEIVYLEQDPTAEPVIKHKEKPKLFPKPSKKRERQHSIYSSDDLPLKKAKNEEENDELSAFIKYITCLLKKLPADVFSNVQIEIINSILRANNQANAANTSQSMVFNKELVNTSSNIITVDGITPVSNTMMGHHNYTITVAPSKESETEINS